MKISSLVLLLLILTYARTNMVIHQGADSTLISVSEIDSIVFIQDNSDEESLLAGDYTWYVREYSADWSSATNEDSGRIGPVTVSGPYQDSSQYLSLEIPLHRVRYFDSLAIHYTTTDPLSFNLVDNDIVFWHVADLLETSAIEKLTFSYDEIQPEKGTSSWELADCFLLNIDVIGGIGTTEPSFKIYDIILYGREEPTILYPTRSQDNELNRSHRYQLIRK